MFIIATAALELTGKGLAFLGPILLRSLEAEVIINDFEDGVLGSLLPTDFVLPELVDPVLEDF